MERMGTPWNLHCGRGNRAATIHRDSHFTCGRPPIADENSFVHLQKGRSTEAVRNEKSLVVNFIQPGIQENLFRDI